MYMGRGHNDTRSFTLSDDSVRTVATVDFANATSLRGVQFAVFNLYEGVETAKIKYSLYVQIVPNGRWVNVKNVNPLGTRDSVIVDASEIGSYGVFAGCLDDMAICGFRIDVQRTAGTVPVPGAVEWCAMDSKQGF